MSTSFTLTQGDAARDGDTPTTVLARALASAAALRETWVTWRRYRRDLAHLQALDDRMLADIGLSRSEIGYAAHFGRPGD